MFFAQIINKMATSLDNFVDERMMMCDIIHMKPANMSMGMSTNTMDLNRIDEQVSFEILIQIQIKNEQFVCHSLTGLCD